MTPTEARLREALTDEVLAALDELLPNQQHDVWPLNFEHARRHLIAALLPVMEEPDAVESRRPDEPPDGESYPEEG